MQMIEYVGVLLVLMPISVALTTFLLDREYHKFGLTHLAMHGEYPQIEGARTLIVWGNGFGITYLVAFAPIAIITAASVASSDQSILKILGFGFVLGLAIGALTYAVLVEWHNFFYVNESSRASLEVRTVTSKLAEKCMLAIGLIYFITSIVIARHWSFVRDVERCVKDRKGSEWVSRDEYTDAVEYCEIFVQVKSENQENN